ncbi:hypothetical protein L1049_003996 [Liquidambar formosana]|uniref:Uncharacterized protein n=1 Tax=Liquidambar formosana TaxID=63359 RepID=A0AAP0RNC6_LIQFO
MENLKDTKQEEEFARINQSRLINHLMSRQSSDGCFHRVNLQGRNVGAAMIMRRRGSAGEPQDCCSINIYVNNNIQGVNNSILVGSEVKLRDPGVCLSFRDVTLGEEFLEIKKNKKDAWGFRVGFCGMFLFVLISLFMLLSLF